MSQLIAIASGKGGVGKTLITAALSVLLQRRGHRVLAADADMGLLYRTYSASSKREDGSSEWDDRPVWGLHHGDPYPFWLDWHPGAGVPS